MNHENSDARWVLYGAYGFTGRMILDHALALGLRPVIAGRSHEKIAALAQRHGLQQCEASVDDAGALERMLYGMRLVLNAAGPFGQTAIPIMRACIKTRTRYVDIGGDVSVLRQQFQLSEAFAREGVGAVLAVGFDVVPTDFAAKWAARDQGNAVAGADELRLGLSLPVSMSRGSTKAVIDELHHGTLVLRDGVLQRVRPRDHRSLFDYGQGPSESIANTWGDLLTAPRTTGIRNVTVYFEATPAVRRAALYSQLLSRPARLQAVRSFLKVIARLLPEGPAEPLRTSRQATVVAHLLRKGRVIRKVRIRTGDAYEFTAASAAKAVLRVLDMEHLSGIETPARALGDDFLEKLPGVSVEDLSHSS